MLQALQYDRLGPDRAPYSAGRQKRLAVQEAATALVCTLLPAIEPVVHVTIKPREKYPMGQTVLRVNEQRELTKQFTRQYLEEQLLTTLAGRACTVMLPGEFGEVESSGTGHSTFWKCGAESCRFMSLCNMLLNAWRLATQPSMPATFMPLPQTKLGGEQQDVCRCIWNG